MALTEGPCSREDCPQREERRVTIALYPYEEVNCGKCWAVVFQAGAEGHLPGDD